MGEVEDAGESPETATPELNLSDETKVKSRNKRLKAKEEIRLRLIAEFLSTKDGREWMYELLSDCHIYSPSHVPGDPCSTAFREGERNIGLRILADVPTDYYALMCTEAKAAK